MASKGIVDRRRVAKAIIATARAHADEVGERLRENLAPVLQEGETLPDMVHLQRLLARYLEMRIGTIIAADEQHLNELDDDREPRRQRDAAAAELYDTLIAIRNALSAAFGQEQASEIVGISGPTPRDPLTLHQEATRALERLSGPTPPSSRIQGLQLDFASLRGQLQPALDNLVQAVQRVDLEARESESTIRSKDLALDAFDAALGGIGRILIGCNELAGLPEFGNRIRLTLPHRRRSQSPSDEATEVAEDGGTEPSVQSPPDPSGEED